jgi:hypothetical protein
MLLVDMNASRFYLFAAHIAVDQLDVHANVNFLCRQIFEHLKMSYRQVNVRSSFCNRTHLWTFFAEEKLLGAKVERKHVSNEIRLEGKCAPAMIALVELGIFVAYMAYTDVLLERTYRVQKLEAIIAIGALMRVEPVLLLEALVACVAAVSNALLVLTATGVLLHIDRADKLFATEATDGVRWGIPNDGCFSVILHRLCVLSR